LPFKLNSCRIRAAWKVFRWREQSAPMRGLGIACRCVREILQQHAALLADNTRLVGRNVSAGARMRPAIASPAYFVFGGGPPRPAEPGHLAGFFALRITRLARRQARAALF
jgi:hypothetical protein